MPALGRREQIAAVVLLVLAGAIGFRRRRV
jgi:MprA protease rhombosortase-interaction domain-containing protein